MLAQLEWSRYLDKAVQVRRAAGVRGLCGRFLRKLVSPALDWGRVTFFVRRLDFAPPAIEAPSHVQLKRVAVSEIPEVHSGGDPTQDPSNLAQRCRGGDQAFAAIANGEPAHLRWLTTSRARIPELGRDIVLGPRQAYFYNGFTRPDMRGHGLDGLVRQFIFQTMHAAGYTEVFSYVRCDNPAGFRAALRWQQPVATLWYFRIRPFRPIIVSRSRSALPLLQLGR